MQMFGRLPSPPGGFFPWFKYSVFTLLGINVLMFMQREWSVAAHLFAHDVAPGELIAAFTATVDGFAWIALLLLFELETAAIAAERIRGRLKWTLHGVRAFCYIFIVYAFYGYLETALKLYQVEPAPVQALCDLAGMGVSYLASIDEYLAVTAANCALLQPSAPLVELTGFPERIVTGIGDLSAARRLAWVDVVNSGTWLLVVVLLEIDVRLKESGRLRGLLRLGSEGGKVFLYAVLFACAVYWGIAGPLLDFWDAFLWLAAFVFIELNIFRKTDA
jgi:hypothetical protein